MLWLLGVTTLTDVLIVVFIDCVGCVFETRLVVRIVVDDGRVNNIWSK